MEGRIVAIDCEMVGVGPTRKDALARVSIVDFHGNVLLDRYVKPKLPITDYRTRWSGIRPKHMKRGITFKQARSSVLKLLNDKVVVGHAIHFDLKILKISQHSLATRDTSKCIRLRQMAKFPEDQTPSLKKLSSAVLKQDIQMTTHCSVEDATATMDLYRLVHEEWEGEITQKSVKKSMRKLSQKYFDDAFWPDYIINGG